MVRWLRLSWLQCCTIPVGKYNTFRARDDHDGRLNSQQAMQFIDSIPFEARKFQRGRAFFQWPAGIMLGFTKKRECPFPMVFRETLEPDSNGVVRLDGALDRETEFEMRPLFHHRVMGEATIRVEPLAGRRWLSAKPDPCCAVRSERIQTAKCCAHGRREKQICGDPETIHRGIQEIQTRISWQRRGDKPAFRLGAKPRPRSGMERLRGASTSFPAKKAPAEPAVPGQVGAHTDRFV